MRLRRRATLEDLSRAIQCLPRHTRVAMLEGIDSQPIIVGAYATSDGICPMLAAHRAGGRTNAISFAHAWDRIAFRDAGPQRARRATERELLILRAHLEASLLDEDAPAAALTRARREHAALKRRRMPRPGDPDRTPELRSRPGWAWTRVVRRLDDYERVLAQLERSAAPEPVAPSLPAAGS